MANGEEGIEISYGTERRKQLDEDGESDGEGEEEANSSDDEFRSSGSLVIRFSGRLLWRNGELAEREGASRALSI